jgi:hypothetical protein
VGPNIHDEVRTKVIYQNLNPVWNPEKVKNICNVLLGFAKAFTCPEKFIKGNLLQDIPTIVMNTFAIDRLEKEYLMVRVTDFDFTTPDDTLGTYIHPFMHLYKHTLYTVGTCILLFIHAWMHSSIQACVHMWANAHTHIFLWMYTFMRTDS